VPSIFRTDWFVSDTTILMQPLAYSDSILFLENRGVFDEPSYAGGKVQYMGPLMRKMSYTREDRSRAREELDLSKEGLVIACLPGGWATEARAPIADLMLSAFNQLLQTDKKLFWIAGCDTDSLIKKTKDRDDVVVMEQLWPIEQLLVASDAVITKGNRGTIMEAAYLGIPSVSLSHGLNSVEEFLVPRIGSNHALRVKGLTPEHLAICIENQLRRSKTDFLPRPVVVPASAVALALIARLGF
jgi:predicted glycosyltransferase